jgi:LysR family transcriptional activator of mexEF-oprN operon
LRAMFNDPLLVRVGNRMEPSARAEEVIKYLTPAWMRCLSPSA